MTHKHTEYSIGAKISLDKQPQVMELHLFPNTQSRTEVEATKMIIEVKLKNFILVPVNGSAGHS